MDFFSFWLNLELLEVVELLRKETLLQVSLKIPIIQFIQVLIFGLLFVI